VEIDRDNNLLKAHGHVVSQLLDKTKDEDASKEGKDPGREKGRAAIRWKTKAAVR
jgi:hypothetical protein